MKLSELIKEAQRLLDAEGDLELLSEDGYAVTGLSFEIAEGLPPDWDMPDGYKYVSVQDGR